MLLVDEDSPTLAVVHAGWRGSRATCSQARSSTSSHHDAVHRISRTSISARLSGRSRSGQNFADVPGALTPDAGRSTPDSIYAPSPSPTVGPQRHERHITVATQSTDGGTTFFIDPCAATVAEDSPSSRDGDRVKQRPSSSATSPRRHLRHADGSLRLDGRTFVETVTFEGVKSLEAPGRGRVAELWYLIAGLSYYKAGAARRIDVGVTPLGTNGRHCSRPRSRRTRRVRLPQPDPTSDVTIEGRVGVQSYERRRPSRVLTPFGGRHRLGRDRREVARASSIRRCSSSVPRPSIHATRGDRRPSPLGRHSRLANARAADRAGRRVLL